MGDETLLYIGSMFSTLLASVIRTVSAIDQSVTPIPCSKLIWFPLRHALSR